MLRTLPFLKGHCHKSMHQASHSIAVCGHKIAPLRSLAHGLVHEHVGLQVAVGAWREGRPRGVGDPTICCNVDRAVVMFIVNTHTHTHTHTQRTSQFEHEWN